MSISLVNKWAMAAAGGALVATTLVGVATPASASRVDYGYLQSNSTCPTYGISNYCMVYLKWGTTITPTKPSTVVTVKCPGNAADGMSIYSAIKGGTLIGLYVGVLWDGGAGYGYINCH